MVVRGAAISVLDLRVSLEFKVVFGVHHVNLLKYFLEGLFLAELPGGLLPLLKCVVAKIGPVGVLDGYPVLEG